MTKSMIKDLSIEDATNMLMYKAFEHSASSFSSFLGNKVTFDVCHKIGTEPLLSHVPIDERLNLLISELRGDLKGICYLVFSKEDTKQIANTQLTGSRAENNELQDALLMELDNILTASFVTVLANELKVSTHAYVPRLKKVNRLELFSVLKSDELIYHLTQKFKVVYLIEGIQISPIFTWAFDANISRHISQWQEKHS